MTANQIAAQSERESERHNLAYETETERHNKETERIDQMKAEITADYNQRSLSLQQDYNTAYLQYLNAAEEDKVALESELNHIKEMQYLTDAQYKSEMTAMGWSQTASENAYRTTMSSLEKKKQEYEKQKADAYITDLVESRKIRNKQADNERFKIEKEYELGIIDANQRNRQLAQVDRQYTLDAKISEAKIANIKAQTESLTYTNQLTQAETKLRNQQRIKTGMDTATSLVNSASNLVDAVMPF